MVQQLMDLYNELLEKGLFKNAESIDGQPLRKFFANDGTLDGLEVTLRQHESSLMKLI